MTKQNQELYKFVNNYFILKWKELVLTLGFVNNWPQNFFVKIQQTLGEMISKPLYNK
jgi:hypothetical protein